MSDTRFGLSIWNTYVNGKPKISEDTPASGIEPYLLHEERTGVLLDPAVGFEGSGIAIPYISESTNDHRQRDPIKITEPVRLDAIGAHIKNSYPPWMITDVKHPPTEKVTTSPTNTEINMFYNTRLDGTPSGEIYYDFQYNRFTNTPMMCVGPEVKDIGLIRGGAIPFSNEFAINDEDNSTISYVGGGAPKEVCEVVVVVAHQVGVVARQVVKFPSNRKEVQFRGFFSPMSVASGASTPIPSVKLALKPINATLQKFVVKLEERNNRDRAILKTLEGRVLRNE